MQLERKTRRKRLRLKDSSLRHKDISSTVNLIKVSFSPRSKDRLGKGTFSMADYQRWQCRSLDVLPEAEKNAFYKDGFLPCALKKDMVANNLRKVQDLKQPIALIKASNNPKAEGSRESFDAQSGLPRNIAICKGAKFRLTSNLWTAMGLTNGASYMPKDQSHQNHLLLSLKPFSTTLAQDGREWKKKFQLVL
jgi:hypothetical protein